MTLIEAAELLGSFDRPLREYAASKLLSQGVHLMKGLVKSVRPTEVELADGQVRSHVLLAGLPNRSLYHVSHSPHPLDSCMLLMITGAAVRSLHLEVRAFSHLEVSVNTDQLIDVDLHDHTATDMECRHSTGVGPTDFTTKLPFLKTAKGM